jgi:hypothetical protein
VGSKRRKERDNARMRIMTTVKRLDDVVVVRTNTVRWRRRMRSNVKERKAIIRDIGNVVDGCVRLTGHALSTATRLRRLGNT